MRRDTARFESTLERAAARERNAQLPPSPSLRTLRRPTRSSFPVVRAAQWGMNWYTIKTVLDAIDVPYEEEIRLGCKVPRPAGN